MNNTLLISVLVVFGDVLFKNCEDNLCISLINWSSIFNLVDSFVILEV